MFFIVFSLNLFSKMVDNFSTHSARMSGVEFRVNGSSAIMLLSIPLIYFFPNCILTLPIRLILMLKIFFPAQKNFSYQRSPSAPFSALSFWLPVLAAGEAAPSQISAFPVSQKFTATVEGCSCAQCQ